MPQNRVFGEHSRPGSGYACQQTLTVDGTVNLLSDSTLVFGLAAVTNDELVRAGGTWSFQSNQKVQLFDLGASVATYTFISGLGGEVTVSGWQLVNSGALDGTFSSDASNIYFTTSVIPEPSTGLLLVAALGALGLRRKRSR